MMPVIYLGRLKKQVIFCFSLFFLQGEFLYLKVNILLIFMLKSERSELRVWIV